MRNKLQEGENISKYEAEARAIILEEQWKAFEEVQSEIEMKMEPSESKTKKDIEKENQIERKIVEEIYYQAAAKLREIIEKAQIQSGQEQQLTIEGTNRERE